MGYSFLIGIIATVMAYLLGVPLGIAMARRKDKLIDKIGTLYIVFIIAVPSLAFRDNRTRQTSKHTSRNTMDDRNRRILQNMLCEDLILG